MSKESSSASSEINRKSYAEKLGGRRFPVVMTQLIAGYAASILPEYSILSRTSIGTYAALGSADGYAELDLTNKMVEALAEKSPDKLRSAFSQRRIISFHSGLSVENLKRACGWLGAEAQDLSRLQELSLLRLESKQEPFEPIFNNIFRKCPNLNKLAINSYAITSEELDGAVLEKLQELTIGGFPLTDFRLQKILSTCPSLKKLTITAYSTITGEGLAADAHEKLEELTIGGFRLADLGLQKILSTFPNLKKLTMKDYIITGKWLDASLEKLEELTVKYCSSLTNSKLQGMLSKCPNLKKLTISSCNNITGEGLDGALLTKLDELTIERCGRLTDLGLQTMLSTCPNLKKLTIAGENTSALTVITLTRNIPTLQELQLPESTDACPQAIAQLIREKPHLVIYDKDRHPITPERAVAVSNGAIPNR